MAKKIRFSLEMKDGIQVRELEELKENFSLEKILYYIDNGKLITWLRDRYHNDIADQIESLDKNDPEYNKKIYDAFEIEYGEAEQTDSEKAAERARKLSMLKEYTDDRQYYDKVDSMAFDQDDLYDLLDEDCTTIYLCGEKFSIPLGKAGITYIGVNNPTVVISSKTVIDFAKKNIMLTNVKYDEKYQALLKEESAKTAEKEVSYYGTFKESDIHFLLSPQDKKASEELYHKLSVQMAGLNYDIELDIKDLKKILYDSGIAGLAKDFLNRL